MKKNIFRVLAIVIDMLLIYFLLLCVSVLPFVKTGKKNMTDEIKMYTEVSNEYGKLSNRLDEMLYDNYIDLSENNEIKTNYPYFRSAFYEVPINSEFDSDLKSKIKKNVQDIYDNNHSLYTYHMNKNNVLITIVKVLISFIYFACIEWLMSGKTLGKRIFRLRTVDNEKIKNKIPFWKYVVKALFVSEIVFDLFNLLFVVICHDGFEGTLNAMWYTKANSILYSVQYVYIVIMMLIMLIRVDGRSIHDIVLNIRVALFDKKNKEVISEIKDEEYHYQIN